MSRAVVFGAGGIGRGFVGALFGSAGWRVTFVDVAEPLVARLAADGRYRQVVVRDDGETFVEIPGVDALLLGDEAAVVGALIDADIVATAVGAENLPPVARLLAAGLEARGRSGGGPLDVLVCENLHDAPAVLMDLVRGEARGDLAPVGMARTSIGRMVPIQIPDPGHPADVRVEPYSLLPYEAAALLGPPPQVRGLVPVEGDFDFYADRKLYLHNLGHCLLAYLGEGQGLTHIWEAVGRFDLRYLVRSAMVEAASALSLRYGQALGPLLDHVDDLLARFGNRGLGDTTARVGRDPVRKMQPGDRLLGAYLLCRAEGIAPRHVSLGVVLGARRLSQEPGWDADRAWALVRDAVGHDDLVALRVLDEAVGGRFDGRRFSDLLDSGFRDGTVL